jgi:hypothetical protein
MRARKKVSTREIERLFERHVYDNSISTRAAGSLSSDGFLTLLDGVMEYSTGYTAMKLRSALHAAYEAALNAQLKPGVPRRVDFGVTWNPIAGIDKLSEYKNARDRNLDESELGEVWRLLNADDASLTARMLRVDLLLGGQRGQQLVRIKVPDDVDLGAELIRLWDIKGKGGARREHLLPLAPVAKREVAWLVEYAQQVKSPYLFPGRIHGTAMSRDTASKLVTEISRSMLASGKSREPFAYLDIRRTIETTLASMDVPPHIRGRIQSHGISGVQARHYDRFKYMPQKREVLVLWERYLTSLLAAPDTPARFRYNSGAADGC